MIIYYFLCYCEIYRQDRSHIRVEFILYLFELLEKFSYVCFAQKHFVFVLVKSIRASGVQLETYISGIAVVNQVLWEILGGILDGYFRLGIHWTGR